MPLPKDYVCDGQMNLWDYMSLTEPKPEKPKCDPDDSVCEGCKWREHKSRELEVDEHGQTWVYKCPGTACANWKFGTPLNLTAQKPEKEDIRWYEPEEVIYCFNRDYLPSLEVAVQIVEEKTGLKFQEQKCSWDETIGKIYVKKVKKRLYEMYEDHYSKPTNDGSRFISVSWDEPTAGSGRPCDNLDEILRFFERALENDKKHSSNN